MIMLTAIQTISKEVANIYRTSYSKIVQSTIFVLNLSVDIIGLLGTNDSNKYYIYVIDSVPISDTPFSSASILFTCGMDKLEEKQLQAFFHNRKPK